MMAFRIAGLMLLAFVTTGLMAAETTVGWRNDGTGSFPTAKPPSEWASDKNVLWKVALPGQSYSAPIVVGANLYVASDPSELLCIRREDGKVLWRKSNSDIKAPAGGGKGGKGGFGKGGGGRSAGNTAATPASDGKHVATALGNGVVAVYDLEGKRLWGKHIESANIGFGHSASPVLVGGKVIVHFKNLVALDVATGKEAWKAELSASHASPVAAKLGKEDVVISPAGAVVRVSDGKILAKGGFRSSENSPVVLGETIYLASRGAFKLEKTKDGVSVSSIWGSEGSGGGGGGGGRERKLPSPVVHDGLLYSVNTSGILEVVEAKSGKSVYRQRLPLGQIYSSVALAGGLLYVFDLEGKCVVFKPGRKYELVSSNRLEGTGSCPVFAGEHLYVRGRQNLYCLGTKPQK